MHLILRGSTASPEDRGLDPPKNNNNWPSAAFPEMGPKQPFRLCLEGSLAPLDVQLIGMLRKLRVWRVWNRS